MLQGFPIGAIVCLLAYLAFHKNGNKPAQRGYFRSTIKITWGSSWSPSRGGDYYWILWDILFTAKCLPLQHEHLIPRLTCHGTSAKEGERERGREGGEEEESAKGGGGEWGGKGRKDERVKEKDDGVQMISTSILGSEVFFLRFLFFI